MTISEPVRIYLVHPDLTTHWKRGSLSKYGRVFDSSKSESTQVKKLRRENDAPDPLFSTSPPDSDKIIVRSQ